MFIPTSTKSLFLSTKVWRTARVFVCGMTDTAGQPNGLLAQSPRKKRQFTDHKQLKNKRKLRKRESRIGPTNEDVLHAEVEALRKAAGLEGQAVEVIVHEQTEADVRITGLASTGEGLGRVDENSSQIFVVPFGIPGDIVRVKAWRIFNEPVPYTLADFISVVKPSPDRDDKLVRCRYFGECSGCQFQMLPYAKQLENKKDIIEKAFRRFSYLPQELVPIVEDVHPSPLEYGFRTKLNPHFEAPPGARNIRRNGNRPLFEKVPPIGFQYRGRPGTLDIEECSIGSDILQVGLKRERQRVVENLKTYTNGVTILLRESTKRATREASDHEAGEVRANPLSYSITEYSDKFVDTKSCVTDNTAISTEYVDDFKFSNPAGSFFQNNNAILPSFISYIKQQISNSSQPYLNLVDAYCGSGLFSITLSSLFQRTIGIDIDVRAIRSAETNMHDNAPLLPPPQRFPSSHARLESAEVGIADDDTIVNSYVNNNSKGVQFISADAATLFESVRDFKPEETVVILDPPRKGCDENFLTQLLAYAPDRIIYISCNVHSQARDIGLLLRGLKKHDDESADYERRMYDIVSLTGFDFFPQTTHVEGIAVLSRKSPGSGAVDSAAATVIAEASPPGQAT